MASPNDQDPRKKQFEKDLKKYEVFGEDSSDEEDDVSGYDVKQKLSDFEKVKNNFPGFIHKKLSFIIYAVAIKFLYSSNIQNAYYEKKKKFRCYEAIFGYEQLESEIEKTALQIVDGNKELILSVVKNTISTKIYDDLAGFFKAFRNENMANFFENLTSPEGDFRYKKFGLLNNLSSIFFNEVWDEERIFFADDESDVFDSIIFFSKLRLQNRLAKRRMIFKPIFSAESTQKSFKWKYSNTNTVFVLNKYTCNDVKLEYVVFDSKTDTKYGNLWKECKSQLGDINKLRIFTNGMRKEYLSFFAAKFHCLLFGLEVMRNPSALIHHMMLFDLIERGQIRWEEVHDKMPMALEGAVEASRYKNSVYSAYMPHNYLYDVERDISYQSDIESELIEREHDLTKKWLENNHFKIIEEGDIKDEYVDRFITRLQSACEDFYNIEAF